MEADGYHWFREHKDGTTFVAYREDGMWYMIGVACPIPPKAIEGGATYLHPVEPPQQHRLN